MARRSNRTALVLANEVAAVETAPEVATLAAYPFPKASDFAAVETAPETVETAPETVETAPEAVETAPEGANPFAAVVSALASNPEALATALTDALEKAATTRERRSEATRKTWLNPVTALARKTVAPVEAFVDGASAGSFPTFAEAYDFFKPKAGFKVSTFGKDRKAFKADRKITLPSTDGKIYLFLAPGSDVPAPVSESDAGESASA